MYNSVLLIISLFFLSFSLSSHAEVTACTPNNCVIVIDAGSTGSRLHLYQQDGGTIHQLFSQKKNPGIADLSRNVQEIPEYLDSLFDGVVLNQPIPVYFNATAGMRLRSQSEQQSTYTAIKQWFEAHSYHLIEAKTITGKYEGVYAWLAVNAYLNQEQTVSVMDMGGASVQIAFPLDTAAVTQSDPDDLIELNVNGKRITLFSHSFLGLGQTEVTHQFLNTAECYPANYLMPNEHLAAGDIEQCLNQIKPLVNRVHHVRKVLTDNRLGKRTDSWYVLGGLSSVAHSELLNLPKTQFTLDELKLAAQQQFCKQDWKMLQSREPENPYLYVDCLSSAYYYALITAGYGLNEINPLHLLSESQVSDWTLGVAINHFNKVF